MFENAYLRFRYILQYTRVLELIWDILNAVNKLQYLLSNHNICYQITIFVIKSAISYTHIKIKNLVLRPIPVEIIFLPICKEALKIQFLIWPLFSTPYLTWYNHNSDFFIFIFSSPGMKLQPFKTGATKPA